MDARIQQAYLKFKDLISRVYSGISEHRQHYYDISELFEFNYKVSQIYPLYVDACGTNTTPLPLKELQIDQKTITLVKWHSLFIKNHAAQPTNVKYVEGLVASIHKNLLSKKELIKSICLRLSEHAKKSNAAVKKLNLVIDAMLCESRSISSSDIEAAHEYAHNFFRKICSSKYRVSKYPYIEQIVSYFKMLLRTPNVDNKFRMHALKILKISSDNYHGDLRKPIAYFQSVCDSTNVSRLRNLFICELSTRIQLLSAQVMQDLKYKDKEKHTLITLLDEILLSLEQMRMTLSFKEDAFESQKIYESIDKIKQYQQTKQTFYPDALDRITSGLNKLLSPDFSSRDLKLYSIVPHLKRYCFHTGMQKVLTLTLPPTIEQLMLLCINLLMMGMKLHMDDVTENYRNIVSNMKTYANYTVMEKNRIISDLLYNEEYLFSIVCGYRESKSFTIETASPNNYALRRM